MKDICTLLKGYLFGRRVFAKEQIRSTEDGSIRERCSQARLHEIDSMMSVIEAHERRPKVRNKKLDDYKKQHDFYFGQHWLHADQVIIKKLVAKIEAKNISEELKRRVSRLREHFFRIRYDAMWIDEAKPIPDYVMAQIELNHLRSRILSRMPTVQIKPYDPFEPVPMPSGIQYDYLMDLIKCYGKSCESKGRAQCLITSNRCARVIGEDLDRIRSYLAKQPHVYRTKQPHV